MVSHRYREYGKGGSSKVGKGEGLESKHVGAQGGLPRKGKKYLVNTYRSVLAEKCYIAAKLQTLSQVI